MCSRSPQNLEFGHFTLLFCWWRQRNVPKHKTHVQSDCCFSLNLLFIDVLVAVAVVVAKTPYQNSGWGGSEVLFFSRRCLKSMLTISYFSQLVLSKIAGLKKGATKLHILIGNRKPSRTPLPKIPMTNLPSSWPGVLPVTVTAHGHLLLTRDVFFSLTQRPPGHVRCRIGQKALRNMDCPNVLRTNLFSMAYKEKKMVA